MESLSIEIKISKEEMQYVFHNDPVIMVKYYQPNMTGDGYICNIQYPTCNNPIKDSTVFESWESLRESVMNRRVRYMNKMNKIKCGDPGYVPYDTRGWVADKEEKIKKLKNFSHNE